jgi:hypothetical protein
LSSAYDSRRAPSLTPFLAEKRVGGDGPSTEKGRRKKEKARRKKEKAIKSIFLIIDDVFKILT